MTRLAHRTIAAALMLTVSVLAVSACSGSTSTSTEGSSPASPSWSVSVVPTSPAPAMSPSATQTPSSGASRDVALPEDVEPGSDAALAWEALMSPVGEYAADATYLAVLAELGQVAPFARIETAERQHIRALARQLGRFAIEVPANPYLGTIEAPDDLKSAAQRGVAAELANIAMYDELLAQVDDPVLAKVFENLRRASLENHLPAFEAAAI